MCYNIRMIKQTTGTYQQLRPGDPDFSFSPDGITVVNRAGFVISMSCPYSHRQIIQECIQNGWLKPVAHMRDTELTWEQLLK